MKKVLIILSFLVVIVSAPIHPSVLAQGRSATPTAELLKRTAPAKLSGTVTAIGISNITVGKVSVNVSSSTILLRRYGAKANLAEFSVGDEVMVLGRWADTAKTMIDARTIRNNSIQKRKAAFLGKITALNSSGFILSPEKRSAQTVSVNLLTKYVERGEKPIALSDLKVGDKVMAKGLWDNKLNTLTEVTFVRDYSLPVKTSKTATPSGLQK